MTDPRQAHQIHYRLKNCDATEECLIVSRSPDSALQEVARRYPDATILSLSLVARESRYPHSAVPRLFVVEESQRTVHEDEAIKAKEDKDEAEDKA